LPYSLIKGHFLLKVIRTVARILGSKADRGSSHSAAHKDKRPPQSPRQQQLRQRHAMSTGTWFSSRYFTATGGGCLAISRQ
jgi:hypothetical protein